MSTTTPRKWLTNASFAGKAGEMKATVVDGEILGAPPGSIKYWRLPATPEGAPPDGFHFICPCGCGGLGGVRFGPSGWTWNGDRDRPTVRPSVYFSRGEPGEWHGWLTAGVWIPA